MGRFQKSYFCDDKTFFNVLKKFPVRHKIPELFPVFFGQIKFTGHPVNSRK